MAQVRVKEDCYLIPDGYKTAGEMFDYTGEPHHCLEYLDKKGKPKPSVDDKSEGSLITTDQPVP